MTWIFYTMYRHHVEEVKITNMIEGNIGDLLCEAFHANINIIRDGHNKTVTVT